MTTPLNQVKLLYFWLVFGGTSSQCKRQSVQMAAHPWCACTLVFINPSCKSHYGYIGIALKISELILLKGSPDIIISAARLPRLPPSGKQF